MVGMTPVLNFSFIKLKAARASSRQLLPRHLTSVFGLPRCAGITHLLVVYCLSVRLLVAANSANGKLEYNRDIRPILAENCFACHGPDSASRKAGLRIDRRDDAIDAKAIVPGKPTESALIARIF